MKGSHGLVASWQIELLDFLKVSSSIDIALISAIPRTISSPPVGRKGFQNRLRENATDITQFPSLLLRSDYGVVADGRLSIDLAPHCIRCFFRFVTTNHEQAKSHLAPYSAVLIVKR